MEELIAKVPVYIKGAALVLSGLVVFATAVAQVTTFTDKDDKIVGKFKVIVDKIIKFLPTIGINPSTKKLEEKVEALEGKNVEVAAAD